MKPRVTNLVRTSIIAIVAVLSFSALSTSSQAALVKTKKPVSAYPVPGTAYASDVTTISFRGINPKQLKLNRIRVVGAKTGVHKGKKLVHSDRRGASWVPNKRFARGEKVRIKTNFRLYGAKRGNFSYRIARLTAKDDSPANPKIPKPTGGLNSRPDLIPTELAVETNLPEKAPGEIFYSAKQNGLAIANADGKTTWFRDFNYDATGITLYNFRVQEYQDRPVLTYWKGASSLLGYSQIGTYEILNRRYKKIATITPGNGYKADIHEFKLTDRDTALVLSYVGIRKNLSKAGGSKEGKILDNVIQEIDVETGAVLFEWHSLGNVPFTTGIGAVPTSPKDSFDYFHANSIDTDGDGYLVSGRRHSSVYRIDQATGKIRWTLAGNGGKNSFKMGPGTRFGYQHDAQRLPNGDISLFDNSQGRFEPPVRDQSSALVLRLGKEGKRRTATLVKRFEHPTGVIAQSQGNAEPLDNGGFFVGWGQVNRMTEFNAAGDIVFDATHSGDSNPQFGVISSYRIYKGDWTGIPSGKPAINSEVSGAGTKVWASWNGSQEIRQWKVLSGPDADNLSEIASADWADLETEIDAPAAGALIAVQAIGDGGKVLGTSNAVPVGKLNTGQGK